MPITVDPANRILSLDSALVSTNQLWSAWADWVVLSDNLKYPPAFSHLGGDAPIPLYVTLENGWKIRPREADGETKITGNLLTRDGLSPWADTIGVWKTRVIIEAPLAAQAIAVASTTVPALDPGESAALIQIGTVLKMMRNKMVTDPTTGQVTIYDDDGSTVLFQGNIFENVAGTVPYQGNGINRRDRMV